MIPTGILGMQVLVRAWVPVDDNHVMFWSMAAPRSRVGNGAAGGASGLNAGGRPVASAGAAAITGQAIVVAGGEVMVG